MILLVSQSNCFSVKNKIRPLYNNAFFCHPDPPVEGEGSLIHKIVGDKDSSLRSE